MTDTPQEIMARGIFSASFHPSERGAEVLDKYIREWPEDWVRAQNKAQADISALKEAGMVIVPKKLTDDASLAFKKAAEDYMVGRLGFNAIHDGWAAALDSIQQRDQ